MFEQVSVLRECVCELEGPLITDVNIRGDSGMGQKLEPRSTM